MENEGIQKVTSGALREEVRGARPTYFPFWQSGKGILVRVGQDIRIFPHIKVTNFSRLPFHEHASLRKNQYGSM